MIGQIAELERGKPDVPCDLILLLLRILLGDMGFGESLSRCFGHEVDQVTESQHSPFAGLERLPVFVVDGAKADVFEHDIVGSDPGLAGSPKDLLEVKTLPHVHDVEHEIGVHVVDAHVHGGQIGGRIQV